MNLQTETMNGDFSFGSSSSIEHKASLVCKLDIYKE